MENLYESTSDDILIHLGDTGDLDFIQLESTTVLLPGNHERNNLSNLEPDYLIDPGTEVSINNVAYRLVHEPNERVKNSLPKVNPDPFYLFGHVHKLCMIKSNGLNVGTDCHHFKPISMETVEFYRNATVNKVYDENVFSYSCGKIV